MLHVYYALFNNKIDNNSDKIDTSLNKETDI